MTLTMIDALGDMTTVTYRSEEDYKSTGRAFETSMLRWDAEPRWACIPGPGR